MNEFWLWFWRPIAEFLGGVALVSALIVAVFVGLILYTLYTAMRQKFCSPHDLVSVNGQWQAARWRCRKCGMETSPSAASRGKQEGK